MTEMTPEKLREATDDYFFGGKPSKLLAKAGLAAASAWMADRARIEALENYICNCGKPNGKHSGWCGIEAALREAAALAQEKKP